MQRKSVKSKKMYMKRLILTVLLSIIAVGLFAQPVKKLQFPDGTTGRIQRKTIVNNEDSLVLQMRDVDDSTGTYTFWKVENDSVYISITQNGIFKGYIEMKDSTTFVAHLCNGVEEKVVFQSPHEFLGPVDYFYPFLC